MEEGRHRVLTQWLAIMIGSLIVSSFIVLWEPSVTGFAVLDAGPSVELKPDLISFEDLLSNATTGLFIILLLVIGQIAIYFFVTRIYKEDEIS